MITEITSEELAAKIETNGHLELIERQTIAAIIRDYARIKSRMSAGGKAKKPTSAVNGQKGGRRISNHSVRAVELREAKRRSRETARAARNKEPPQ